MFTERHLEKFAEIKLLLESGWAQKCFARDSFGMECNALSESASAWCLAGAIKRAFKHNSGLENIVYVAVSLVLQPKWDEEDDKILERFNDAPKRTLQEVLDLLGPAKTIFRGLLST